MINVTIINDHQIYYLHAEDVIYIRKGQMPSDLRKDYVEVHTYKGRLEIDNMKVQDLHKLLSSGKAETIKNIFRRL